MLNEYLKCLIHAVYMISDFTVCGDQILAKYKAHAMQFSFVWQNEISVNTVSVNTVKRICNFLIWVPRNVTLCKYAHVHTQNSFSHYSVDSPPDFFTHAVDQNNWHLWHFYYLKWIFLSFTLSSPPNPPPLCLSLFFRAWSQTVFTKWKSLNWKRSLRDASGWTKTKGNYNVYKVVQQTETSVTKELQRRVCAPAVVVMF